MSPTKNIMLVACGSFSPPTPMHFRMFEIARDHYLLNGGYKVVGGIVSPVHDSYAKKGLAPAKHRCAMVKVALQSSNWIRLSDWECNQQDKWTRTRISLQYHQNYINSYLNDLNGTVNEILPGWIPDGVKNLSGPVQLKLLCGADLLESFAVPGLWQDDDIEAILGQHGLVVVTRSGTNPEQFIFESDILHKYRANITIVRNWVQNEVSSTMVRRLLGRGLSVKYLLDDNITEYIYKNQLFGVKDAKYILSPNQNQMILLEPALPALNINEFYVNNKNLSKNRPPSPPPYEDMDETDTYSSITKICVTNSAASAEGQKSSTVEAVQASIVHTAVSAAPATLAIDRSTAMFCCGGDTLNNVKSLLHRPGQAVQILTGVNSGGCSTRRAINDEVGVQLTHKDDNGGDDDHDVVVDDIDDEVFEVDDKIVLDDNESGCTFGTIDTVDTVDTNALASSSKSSSPAIERIEFDVLSDALSDDGLPVRTSRNQRELIKFVFTEHGIRVISDKEYVV